MIFHLHSQVKDKIALQYFKKAIQMNSTDILFPKKYCLTIGNINLVHWCILNPQIRQFMIKNGFFVAASHSKVPQQHLLMLGRVLKYVLRPQPIVLAEMNRIVPHFNSTSYVGVHLRCGGRLSDMHDPSTYLTMEQLHRVFNHLRNIPDSLPIFLSTDSKIAKESMRKSLSTKTIYTYTKPVVIADSQLMTPEKALSYLLSAVSELMLLGHSSECYGTSGSTFTHVGCALARKIPYIIGKKSTNVARLGSNYSYL